MKPGGNGTVSSFRIPGVPSAAFIRPTQNERAPHYGRLARFVENPEMPDVGERAGYRLRRRVWLTLGSDLAGGEKLRGTIRGCGMIGLVTVTGGGTGLPGRIKNWKSVF